MPPAPQVAPPQIAFNVTYPGASAQVVQVVEDTVVKLIEQKMNGIEHLLYMEASSELGAVTLTFEPGTNAPFLASRWCGLLGATNMSVVVLSGLVVVAHKRLAVPACPKPVFQAMRPVCRRQLPNHHFKLNSIRADFCLAVDRTAFMN